MLVLVDDVLEFGCGNRLDQRGCGQGGLQSGLRPGDANTPTPSGGASGRITYFAPFRAIVPDDFAERDDGLSAR
jgi:hypothetical protein